MYLMDVVFRRRNFRGMVVNRQKHVIQAQNAVTIGGVGLTVDLIDTVDAPVSTGVSEQCASFSKVSSIFLHVEAIATSEQSTIPNLYFIIFKNPGGNLTAPQGNLVGINDNKKYVIHQEMIMGNGNVGANSTTAPRNMFQGVIRIPRGYQRNGVNDKLQIVFFSPGVEWSVCFDCIYQEYR